MVYPARGGINMPTDPISRGEKGRALVIVETNHHYKTKNLQTKKKQGIGVSQQKFEKVSHRLRNMEQ